MRGETPAPVPNRGAITLSIMLATFMQWVDTTIANVALPHMQGSFSAAQDQIALVITSYIVAAAIMTPLTGWLAGRFGIKYVFFISVAGFTLASALCSTASVWARCAMIVTIARNTARREARIPILFPIRSFSPPSCSWWMCWARSTA